MFLQDPSSAATTLTSSLDYNLLLTRTVTQTLLLLVHILHYSEVNWWWEFLFFLSLPFRGLSWSGSRLRFNDLDDGNGCMSMKNADNIKQQRAAMRFGLPADLKMFGTGLGTSRYDSRRWERLHSGRNNHMHWYWVPVPGCQSRQLLPRRGGRVGNGSWMGRSRCCVVRRKGRGDLKVWAVVWPHRHLKLFFFVIFAPKSLQTECWDQVWALLLTKMQTTEPSGECAEV